MSGPLLMAPPSLVSGPETPQAVPALLANGNCRAVHSTLPLAQRAAGEAAQKWHYAPNRRWGPAHSNPEE
jgi:hypothetical protein